MNLFNRRTTILFALVTVSAFVALSAWAQSPNTKAKTKPKPAAVADKAPANAVQKEMRMLEKAMQQSVSAIAAGDVRGLPKLLHGVHMAGGDTNAALKSGKYKLPKNSKDIDAFAALDAVFHKEMIVMVKAAKKNDVATTATQFGVLMNKCQACHQTYRD